MATKPALEAYGDQKFSLIGYSLKTWAVKNKELLKNIFAGIVGLITFYSTNLPSQWSTLIGLVTGGLARWASDLIDYWQSE